MGAPNAGIIRTPVARRDRSVSIFIIRVISNIYYTNFPNLAVARGFRGASLECLPHEICAVASVSFEHPLMGALLGALLFSRHEPDRSPGSNLNRRDLSSKQTMMRGTMACLGIVLCCTLAVGAVPGQNCPTPRCPGKEEACGGADAGTCSDETRGPCTVKSCTCLSGFKGGGKRPCISEAQLAEDNEGKKEEAVANRQRKEEEKLEKEKCTDDEVPPPPPASPADPPPSYRAIPPNLDLVSCGCGGDRL